MAKYKMGYTPGKTLYEYDTDVDGETSYELRDGTWYPKPGETGEPADWDDLYTPGYPPDHYYNSDYWIKEAESSRYE